MVKEFTLQAAREYEEKYGAFVPAESRPLFHLTPRIGWLNDPNGFGWYRGQYHLFFQYHPYSTRWGPMHWGHAVSKDLLHWEYLPCALAPDTDYDRAGCFSGSSIELPDGRQLLLYTGTRAEIQPDGSRKEYQTQCVAVGDGLNYQKLPQNPVIGADLVPEGGSILDFRDPKIWREPDGSYRCVVADRTEDGSGSLLIYRSADAVTWEYDGMLDRCYNEYGKMWECPDCFWLDGRYVVLAGAQDMTASGLEFHNGNGTFCLVGSMDPKTGRFEREHIQSIDYGLDFYATQTMLAPDGRRIMVAWMQNWDACVPSDPEQRWFGQIALPRELSVKNGRLIQTPVRELEAMRGRKVYHRTLVTNETSLPNVYGRTVDMTVTLEPCGEAGYGEFRMKVAQGSRHYTMITYKPLTSVLRVDRCHAGSMRDFVHERKCLVRPQGGKLKLRVILDRFSVEIFVNDGEQVLSSTIYTPLSAEGISFEALNGQLQLTVEHYALS